MRGLHFKVFSLVAVSVAALAMSAFSQTQVIFPNTSSWKFYTNSAGYRTDPGFGTTWKDIGFDDSAWPMGTGLFGDETIYPYPIATPIPGPSETGNTGPLTIYFRTSFNWPGAPAGVLVSGTNFVDDGAVVYLNGIEITRFNMPTAGDPAFNSLSGGANPAGFPNVNGTPTVGEPVMVRMDIDLDAMTNGNANPLVTGPNVLAVAVHNAAVDSSDVAFAMSLFLSQRICPATDGIQPTNRTVVENSSTTLIVNGSGVPSPTYQWYRSVGAGDEVIAGATATSYTITNAKPADAGEYFVRLQNTCVAPVDSRRAVVTVQLDTTAPRLVFARCGTNADEVIVRLSEPLDNTRPDRVNDEFLWKLNTIAGPGAALDINSVAYATGDVNLYFKLSGPLDSGSSYQVTNAAVFFDVSATGNPLPMGSSVLVSCHLNKTLVEFENEWKYEDTGTSFDGTGWEAAGFNDAAWKSGPGIFDGKRGGAGTPDVCRVPATVGGVTIGTCIAISNAAVTTGLPTYYFRHKFQAGASDLTNLLGVVTTLDDGAILYLNGTELIRVGAADSTLFGPTAAVYANYIGGTAVGDAALATNYVYVGSSLIAGENTIAAITKQVNNTSSDVTFGLQLLSIGAFPAVVGPTLTIAYVGADLVITWSPANGVLQSKNTINGTWADVTPAPAAGGPYVVPVVGAANFYSLRQ